jgi:hypothetical protein
MGAIGMMGSMAALLVLMTTTPPPSSLAGYALIHGAMGDIATWIFVPSLGLTLVPGMIAIAATSAFQNAAWAWVKMAIGFLIFLGGIVFIEGPIKDEARRSASALGGHLDPATLAGANVAEPSWVWALLLLATANVVLGVWRPRFTRIRG